MSAARTTAVRPDQSRMSGTRTIVCLSPDLKPAWLPQLATAKLRTLGFGVTGPVPYFPARTRRAGKLIDRCNGLTSGGPIGLLDLTAMRQQAQAAAAAQWWLWRQVVADTKPADPFWHFVDRHRADPRRYPLTQAKAEYLAQPRVLVMTIHNARPDTRIPLPTAALESFQAGYTAHLSMAMLAAVPADGVATTYGAYGGWLTCASERLTDQLAYLQAANAHIDGLGTNVQLIAMAINR